MVQNPIVQNSPPGNSNTFVPNTPTQTPVIQRSTHERVTQPVQPKIVKKKPRQFPLEKWKILSLNDLKRVFTQNSIDLSHLAQSYLLQKKHFIPKIPSLLRSCTTFIINKECEKKFRKKGIRSDFFEFYGIFLETVPPNLLFEYGDPANEYQLIPTISNSSCFTSTSQSIFESSVRLLSFIFIDLL